MNQQTFRAGCTPIINLSESSPKATTSPAEMRIPNTFDYKNGRPSTRLDDPRQQEFAFRNIDSAMQRGKSAEAVRPFFPENETHPNNMAPRLPGIFAQDNWSSINPAGNGAISMNGFDTEMSDQTNNSSNSTGLTPQSSSSYNQSSSNTSYTPPGDDAAATQTASRQNVAGTYTSYTSVYTPPAENMFVTQESVSTNARSPVNGNVNGNEQDDPFKMPTNWDLDTGATPNVLSGMTPEGGWEKMMESWDRTG
jgi:hypothetical protein